MACITTIPGKRGDSHRVQVWDPQAGKLHRKTFRALAEARGWRDDVRAAVKHGTMRSASRTTVREAALSLLAGMEAGSILDRSGRPYKPATRRSYEQALRDYVLPDLGQRSLSDVRRADVQDMVDRWRTRGLSPSTIANKLDPLRVLYRRAINRDEVTIDPTKGLELPAVTGRRDRIANPQEAAALIEALPTGERALWATALYAGLRRGELRALAWSQVDFDTGIIRVEYGWDDVDGRIEVKSDAGRRRIPLVGNLRKLLAGQQLATGRRGDDLCFGRTATAPFVPSTVRTRARKAWKAAKLEPLTPHEARHYAASYLIAAGLNPKQLSVYIGHSDIRTTYNRYGHLMPGGEVEATEQLRRQAHDRPSGQEEARRGPVQVGSVWPRDQGGERAAPAGRRAAGEVGRRGRVLDGVRDRAPLEPRHRRRDRSRAPRAPEASTRPGARGRRRDRAGARDRGPYETSYLSRYRTSPQTQKRPRFAGPFLYRYGDSNPGFRRERAAS